MFDHTADIGVEIFGRTKKELFANAAWALTDLMLNRRAGEEVKGRKKRLSLEGEDTADLLVNFLRELLYLFNGEACIVQSCQIMEISNQRLVAELIAKPFVRNREAVKMELKAVTYHGLSVVKDKRGWKAKVIFDV